MAVIVAPERDCSIAIRRDCFDPRSSLFLLDALAGSFAPRSFVELRPEHLPLLRREHTGALENAPAEPLCWGGVYPEDEIAASQRVRSTAAEKISVAGFSTG